jgi:hypothetical protein
MTVVQMGGLVVLAVIAILEDRSQRGLAKRQGRSLSRRARPPRRSNPQTNSDRQYSSESDVLTRPRQSLAIAKSSKESPAA